MEEATRTRMLAADEPTAASETKGGAYLRRLLLCLSLFFLILPETPPRPAPDEPPPLADVPDDGTALPTPAQMDRLARTDPIAFLRYCILRYERQVHGYRCILNKQERFEGKLLPPEVIDVAFREKPFSVLLQWKEGALKALRALYVKGENNDQVLVKPAGRFLSYLVVKTDPKGADARASGRYPLTEFGIAVGMRRTLYAMERARKEHALHVECEGVRPIPELDNRECYVFHRTGYRKPEEAERDGITDLTFYIDKETWLQTGSILKGKDGQLLGQFFFRQVQLNPTFPPDTFTRAAVAR